MDILLRNGYEVNLSLLRQGQMQASASRLAGQELVKVGNEAISKDEYISRQYDLLETANDILMQNSQAYLYKGGSDSVNGYSTGFLGSSAYRANMPMWSIWTTRIELLKKDIIDFKDRMRIADSVFLSVCQIPGRP